MIPPLSSGCFRIDYLTVFNGRQGQKTVLITPAHYNNNILYCLLPTGVGQIQREMTGRNNLVSTYSVRDELTPKI